MAFTKTGAPETGRVIVSGDDREEIEVATDDDIRALFGKEDEGEREDAADGK